MNAEDFQKELDKRNAEQKDQQDKQAHINAINKAGIKNVEATNRNTESTANALKNVRGEVKVTNPDLAKTADMNGVMDSIKNLNLTTFMSTRGYHDMAENIAQVHDGLQMLQKQYQEQGLPDAAKSLGTVVDKVGALVKMLTSSKVSLDSKLQKTLDNLSKSIDAIEFNPTVSVEAPKVTVPRVDVSGIEKAIANLAQTDEGGTLDLDDYMAHDLDDMEQGVQYVGFVNSKGNWYIVKNVEAENSLRYAFGNDAYADFWPKASQLDYTVLNEALHEVPA
jgi:hypothetical protein